MRRGAIGRILWAALALAVAAAAAQPVYRVDANTIFLPLNGVALNARNGRVAWRFPRYRGHTFTDGHGLLLLSWVAAIAPHLHHRTTRICRLRTQDGRTLWCADRAGVTQWVVDNSGRYVYIHTAGRLEVLQAANGRPDRGFELTGDRDLTLLPLPGGGVAMLKRSHGQAQEVETWRPGAAVLHAEMVPTGTYAFRGDGQGLLLYAKPKHEFFLAAPLERLFGGLGGTGRPQGFFPAASLSGAGFILSDWQGDTPVVRGGNYQGAHWQAPRSGRAGAGNDAHFAISRHTGVLLAPISDTSSRLEGWDLNNGKQRFREPIRGRDEVLHAGDGVIVLQSSNDVRLLDAHNGKQRWQWARETGTLAAITRPAVVFWDGSGNLLALARGHGMPLWRVHFQRVGLGLP